MAESSTEARHPASEGFHTLAGQEALAVLLDAQVAALDALRPAIPALERVADAAAASLRAGGKLGYAGAGSSGLMALADCLELAGTFGIAPERTPMMLAGGTQSLLRLTGSVEDDPALALADLDRSGLGAGDTLLCLSASGRTPYALAMAEAARARGVTVAGFTAPSVRASAATASSRETPAMAATMRAARSISLILSATRLTI